MAPVHPPCRMTLLAHHPDYIEIREKLSEEGLADRVKVKIVKVGETLKLGDFKVEWVPLALRRVLELINVS